MLLWKRDAPSPAVGHAIAALKLATESIVDDTSLSEADRTAALNTCGEDFLKHIETVAKGGIEDAAVKKALADAGITIKPAGAVSKVEGDAMTIELKKSLGLKDTATDAEVEAAIATLKRDSRIAKMTPAHREYFDSAELSDVEKAAFADGDDAARAAAMAKKPAKKTEDETLKLDDGSVISKSKVGDQTFGFMKAELAKRQTLETAVAKANDKIAREDVIKRVTPLTLIGKADEIGDVLHQIAKFDPALSTKVEGILKGLNETLAKGKTFEEIGSSRTGVTKALEAITAKAQELRKTNPTWSIEKARTEARKQNPDLAKQEADEQRAMKAAA